MKPHILIVDDETAICISLKYTLSKDYEVSIAANAEEAMAAMEDSSIRLVLLDLFLGRDDGMALLGQMKERRPDLVIIVMTAHGSIRSSVTAMKKGAFTYMTKPLDIEELKIFLQQVRIRRRIRPRAASRATRSISRSTLRHCGKNMKIL